MASITFFGVLPVVALVLMFYEAVRVDGVAFDFRVFYVAAEAALRGDTLYPAIDDAALVAGRVYVYPPVTALVFAPLTAVPMEAAGLFVMVLLVAAVVATPLVLGVRDWRCVGLVLLWPPVISAIQTGSVTLFLGLAAALVWRYRDRPVPAGLALGAALAVKLLLWPVGVWLAATRRVSAAAFALVAALLLALGSWAVVAFDGLGGYPALLQRLSEVMDDRGYTVYSLALEYGVPSQAARLAWAALALGLLTAVVVRGRRGDDRGAFVLAVAASLAVTPIVWLHYLALLVLVVGVARPRLGLLWFVPLALVVTPGSGNPTPFETTATMLVAGLTVALALHELSSRPFLGRLRASEADPAR
jgi:hypothetical protein